jgi:hypothetical protein
MVRAWRLYLMGGRSLPPASHNRHYAQQRTCLETPPLLGLKNGAAEVQGWLCRRYPLPDESGDARPDRGVSGHLTFCCYNEGR